MEMLNSHIWSSLTLLFLLLFIRSRNQHPKVVIKREEVYLRNCQSLMKSSKQTAINHQADTLMVNSRKITTITIVIISAI